MSFESLPRTGEQNHFNLLRLIAASAVICSHAYSLTLGGEAPDPLESAVGMDLGTTAVIAFFAISGYFISLSFERRPSNLAFVVARFTRIWPGLAVVALVSAFLMGPLLTELPLVRYFADRSVWLYVPKTLALASAFTDPQLAGVFTDNPAPRTVNGSLWTLFFEVSCYAGLFAAGLLGLLRRTRFHWLLLAWLPAYAFARYGPLSSDLKFFALFSLPFLIGMAVFHYRELGALKGWVAVALAAAAFAASLSGHFVEELWSAAVAYGVLCLGFARAPALLGYNKVGDFSYGTYIYGFPVGQTLVALIPGIDAFALMALSLPIAILCGALSWFLVERPALELRKKWRAPARRPQAAGTTQASAQQLSASGDGRAR